jgi:uncharacterized membrane protein
MDGILLAFLGPFTNWILAISFAVVVLKRHSIRKRHIVILLATTVLGFVAFFAVLVWGFTWPDPGRYAALYQGLLRVIAGLVVGCASAVGFSFILKHLGLAKLEDR